VFEVRAGWSCGEIICAYKYIYTRRSDVFVVQVSLVLKVKPSK
jgi:hypothetical protein